MKFIFPKNYTFKTKLFGFIDYSTAICNGIIALIIYALSNLFFNRLSYKLYFFICLYFPIFLFSVICFQRENILSVLKYTFSFFKNRNIYFYNKKHFNIDENSKKDK